ncbi:hypothetical protein V2J09_018457 [Rumex salicifolius]
MAETEQKRELKQVKRLKPHKNGRPKNPSNTQILVSDFILSFLWVYSNSMIKLLVHQVLGLPHTHTADIVTCAFKIVNMFLFALLISISKGGSYNPLTVMAAAISGGFTRFLFTIGARIPAQVFGSIVGVKLLIATIPGIGRGPKLNVEIHQGALTEGVLSFMVAVISMGLTKNLPGSFYMKNWILSISKITLNILGSDLTGGSMNPASVMGWAFVCDDHITQEHLVVYWLAPVIATLFAVWTQSGMHHVNSYDEKTYISYLICADEVEMEDVQCIDPPKDSGDQTFAHSCCKPSSVKRVVGGSGSRFLGIIPGSRADVMHRNNKA